MILERRVITSVENTHQGRLFAYGYISELKKSGTYVGREDKDGRIHIESCYQIRIKDDMDNVAANSNSNKYSDRE